MDLSMGYQVPEPLRINQIKVLGTHNSYSLPIASSVCDHMDSLSSYFYNNLVDWSIYPESVFEYHPVCLLIT